MEFRFFVYIICGILGLLLIFKEFNRGKSANLTLRILASLFLVISFAFLMVPLTYETVLNKSITELNIITEGTNLDTIANINGEKYDLDSNLFLERKKLKINHIEDLAYYLQENKDIKKVNIYGYGLAAEELEILKDYQITFHPAITPTGIISASWKKKISETENLILQGVYNNESDKDVKLKLFGLGANLDSIIVKSNTKSNFSFNHQPKQSGLAVYQLIAFKGNDTLSVDPIPFEVKAKKAIQVLLLASFPDFEYKFLKNWLYEKQYQVVFRSQISKDKYTSDFLNTKVVDVSRITQVLLNQTDILLIDENELSSILAGERANINAAVGNGMGLIIRVINAKPNANSPKYGRYEVNESASTPMKIIAFNENVKFSELPFLQTLFLETTLSEQTLFKSSTGKSVANIQLNGMGKIILTSIASTYQWVLAGKQTDYALFWSSLFAKTARKETINESIEFFPQFLNIGSKVSLVANLSAVKVPVLAFNEVKLHPKQNMELPFKWEATFWPTSTGWNKLSVNNSLENVFVYQKTDWVALSNNNKLNLNSSFSRQQSNETKEFKSASELVTQEISKWWFYIIFIIAAGYLWYEQRFLAN